MDQSLDQIMGGVCSVGFSHIVLVLIKQLARSIDFGARAFDKVLRPLAHIFQVRKLKAIALDISTEVKTQG